MVDVKRQEIFSEVYAFLNIVEETDRNKVPEKLMNLIIKEKSVDYNPQYDAQIPIKEQNLKRESLAMIALIDLNYWCKTEEEKNELRNIFSENEKKYQEELRQKYNPDDIFKNENKQYNNVSMIEYKEGTVIQKNDSENKKVFLNVRDKLKIGGVEI